MVAKNFGGFSADLNKFSKMMDISVSKVRRKVSLDLLKAITNMTPVKTGRAALSWNLSEGSPNTVVAPPGGGGGAAARAVAQQRGALALTDNPFATSYIVNSLPYIMALEFGHSKQAPMGMVRISLANIEAGLLSRG